MGYAIEGSTGTWEVVVGLEVHAQVISRAKLFSGAATDFGAPPNSHSAFCNPSLKLSKLSEKQIVTSSQFEYVSTK